PSELTQSALVNTVDAASTFLRRLSTFTNPLPAAAVPARRATTAWDDLVTHKPDNSDQALDDALVQIADFGRNAFIAGAQWTRHLVDLEPGAPPPDQTVRAALDRVGRTVQFLGQDASMLAVELDRLRLDPDSGSRRDQLSSHLINTGDALRESVIGLVTGDAHATADAQSAWQRAGRAWDGVVTSPPRNGADRENRLVANLVDAGVQALGWTTQTFNWYVWDPIKSDAPPEVQVQQRQQRFLGDLGRIMEDGAVILHALVPPLPGEGTVLASPATPPATPPPEPTPPAPQEPAVQPQGDQQQATSVGGRLPAAPRPAQSPPVAATPGGTATSGGANSAKARVAGEDGNGSADAGLDPGSSPEM